MTHKFKVGDKVRCVDDETTTYKLKKGEIYKITQTYNHGSGVSIDGCDGVFHTLRFELVQEGKQMASRLINGRPMSELNAEPNRPVVVIGTAVTEAFVVYSTIAFREGEEYYSEWAEILKPEPKPDANGWWKFADKMPEVGKSVQAAKYSVMRQCGWDCVTVIAQEYSDFRNYTHWKLWEGPVDV